jgi:hypothetical protein
VLAARVLGPNSSVPPATRAELFGDLALQQLAELCAPAAHAEEAEGLDSEAASLAATAACETLIAVLTDPAHGLVGESQPLDTPLLFAPASAAAAGPAAGLSSKAAKGAGAAAAGSTGVSGTKRVLRLLPRLQPAAVPRHVRVLEALASAQPALAAEYLSGGPPLLLEPKVGYSSVCYQ